LLRCSDVGRVAEVRVANGEFRGNADGERNVDGDLGVLAGRLLFSIQDELFRRLHGAGFTDLVPRHGAVLAYLRLAGIRATELSRLSGQHKQVIGKNVDELEELGYVERVPDPGDRRAKLVVPTERGRRQMRTADSIMADIADRNRRHLGTEEFDRFLHLFRTIVRHQREAQPNGSAE
jgi:DNA-binding MarR family transcriptional regulator